MNQLTQITDAALQTQTVALPDGTTFSITLYYMPRQLGWVISNLTYGSFVLQGFRVSNSPNMLHQWKNIIPFGLACISDGDREPMLQQDFASGSSAIYLLSAAEVLQYAEYLSG